MKRVVAVLIAIGMLTGCSPAKAQPAMTSESTPAVVPKTIAVPLPVPKTASAKLFSGSDMPGFDTNASPAVAPAQVSIGNLYPGAIAEWQMLIHNGDGLTSKLIQIETDAKETIADIPLPIILEDGLSDIKRIESNLPTDALKAIAYHDKSLTIQGFTPSAKRITKITYTSSSNFIQYYRVPDDTTDGYDKPSVETKGWVTFDKSSLLLHPMETGRITVTLKIPADAKVSGKWEFWVGVMEASGQEQNAPVSTDIELCSRVLVSMR